MLTIASGILLAYLFLMVTRAGASMVLAGDDIAGQRLNLGGLALMLAPTAFLLWFLFF